MGREAVTRERSVVVFVTVAGAMSMVASLLSGLDLLLGHM